MISHEEFIKIYTEYVINDETSFFFGAGLSKNYGLPLWEDLTANLKERLGIDNCESLDYALIAQYYENKHSKIDLRKHIENLIDKKSVITNEKTAILSQLLLLKPQNIWTTNYDTIIEQQCGLLKIDCEVISAERDLPNISGKKMNLFKLGGNIKNNDNLFLTKIDYENFSRPTLLTLLTRELITKHFLFIGYSFTDGIVKKQIQVTKKILESGNINSTSMPAHYAIIFRKNDSSFDLFINDIEIKYNITPIIVEDEDDFFKLLSDLLKSIKQKYVFISGSFDNFENNIQSKYIYTLCKKLAHKLIDNEYCIVNAVGKNVGNVICGSALAQLNKNTCISSNKKLIVHPLPTDTNDDLIDSKSGNIRNDLVKKCGSIIFINGKKPNNSGTFAEFKIAKENGLKLIPIANTGGAAQKIYKTMLMNNEIENQIDVMNHVPTTLEEIDSLTDKVVSSVMNIINKK